ncbi:Protein CBG27984 [Caenorhabditis briggsae]|uniref:Uncharacterized protein n=2 Tax=Caenorhabditis briggsae TaxID=6238 RepID=A0AAE9FK53_CAEBR|nr:Protein CBG27984 [Caenorhabditis briggsae]ULT83916.1 hypothetical protein L3Y34_012898 [Caenorhabditis briggsae]UMM43160.1 hypothetical protein L5515_018750 [Caenorhabditis briggsae]CAS00156.1 Protein CBG27984 [Caenorhabditis briggsae]
MCKKQPEGNQQGEEKHWMQVIPGPNLDGTWSCIGEFVRPENPNDIGQYIEFLSPGPDEFHFPSPEAFLKACREGKVKGHGPDGNSIPNSERHFEHREGTQSKEEKHWMQVIPGPNLDGTWSCIGEFVRPENPNDIGQYIEFLSPGPDEFHFPSPEAFLKACREGKVKGHGPGGKTLDPVRPQISRNSMFESDEEEERLPSHRVSKLRMKKRRNNGECGPKRNYRRKDQDDKDRDENSQNYQHSYCTGSAVRRMINT